MLSIHLRLGLPSGLFPFQNCHSYTKTHKCHSLYQSFTVIIIIIIMIIIISSLSVGATVPDELCNKLGSEMST
jgi:hypothetical protein